MNMVQPLNADYLGKLPFLHRGLTRKQATKLLRKYEIDGLFLIRVCAPPEPEGLIVLTYKANGRIYHTRIYQILETLPTRHQTIVLSVDYGHTKFYDLEQLVHYYQLNAGCLIGRLTHYIVNGPEALQIEGSDSDEDSL